jgi:hypothetical protein
MEDAHERVKQTTKDCFVTEQQKKWINLIPKPTEISTQLSHC